MRWIKTTQKAVPLLSRYIATKFSLSKYVSKSCLHRVNFKHYKYISSKNEVQAFFSKDELNNFYEVLWKNARGKRKLNNFILEYKKSGEKLLKISLKIKNKKIKDLSNKELIKIFKLFVENYTYFIAFIYNGNFLVNVYTKKLLNILGKSREDEEFRKLIENSRDTTIKKMQKDIFKLFNLAKDKKLLSKNFNDLSDSIKNKIMDVHNRYIFMGSVFLTTNKYPTVKSFWREIKNYSYFQKDPNTQSAGKDSIIKKLKISNEELDIINELATLSFYRTEMLFYAQKSEYNALNLFESIADRLNIRYGELVYMTYEEIIKSLSQNKLAVTISKIRKRFNNYKIMLKDGDIELLNAGEAKNYNITRSIIVKGSVGSPGKVAGRVRIIRNSSEIHKIKNGEILVTYMTTPDFVVGMKKAAAIITNDGGITCHAAIIARELEKPCIIGTKIATTVLKDGDLVEVDADKGVVKILKKK